MNDGAYIYEIYPYPFGIAFIRFGVYASGLYRCYEADMFLSKDLLNAHSALLFLEKDPIGHICETCNKVCRNIHCCGCCCDWEQIPGMVSGRWG